MDLAPNHLNLNFELPAHAGLTIHQNETTQRLRQQLPNAKNRVIYESLSAEIQHAPTHPVGSQSQPASAVRKQGARVTGPKAAGNRAVAELNTSGLRTYLRL